MGTRQEIGIVVTLLLLALPGLFGVLRGAEPDQVPTSETSSHLDVETLSGAHHLILGLPISLNTASSEDLQAIPGIGPALAERIIETRNRIGRFGSIQELTKVKGIGPKRLDKLRRFLALGDEVNR